MLSSFDLLYTGAIFLNNAGVSLFERQETDHAMRCFTDALRLIQELSNTPNADGSYNVPSAQVKNCLHQVSQQLVATTSTPPRTTTTPGPNSTPASGKQHCGATPPAVAADLQVATEKEVASTLHSTTSSSLSSIPVTVMIRLELMATSIPDPKTYCAGLESAIVLYNTGHCRKQQKLQNCSAVGDLDDISANNATHHLFQLAFSLLETMSGQGQQVNNEVLLSQDFMVPFGILLLQQLIQTSRDLDQAFEYQYYSCLAHNLEQAFRKQDYLDKVHPPAGAA